MLVCFLGSDTNFKSIYRASDMSNLKKHIKKTKKHHGLNMFMCKSCQFSTDNPFEFVNHSKQVCLKL